MNKENNNEKSKTNNQKEKWNQKVRGQTCWVSRFLGSSVTAVCPPLPETKNPIFSSFTWAYFYLTNQKMYIIIICQKLSQSPLAN